MNLIKEMEINYKDFIESANDFMDSCREYNNFNEDEIIKQLISLRHHCNSMNDEIFKKDAESLDYILRYYKSNRAKISERNNTILEKEHEIIKLQNEITELKKKIYAINLLSKMEE